MSKAQDVAQRLNTFLGEGLGNEAADLLREQDALLHQLRLDLIQLHNNGCNWSGQTMCKELVKKIEGALQ